jgi:GNAT superfamily N-acetyltransferase
MVEAYVFLSDAPDDEAHRVIYEGLHDHAREQVGYFDYRQLAVLARDPASGRILGGLTGRTFLGLMFIELAFLPRHLRSRGLGSSMLRMAEEEAARRRCHTGILDTMSFQAPDFYERRGWRELARIPCDPCGTFRIRMTKDLARKGT